MSDTPPIEAEKVDVTNDVHVSMESVDGTTLEISVRAPKLAAVIEKMVKFNWPKEKVNKIFHPILDFPVVAEDASDELKAQAAANFYTRPAVYKITKNFVAGGSELNLEQAPPALMVYNPTALRDGYKLLIKIEKPYPPDVLRRWGKQFIDGCADIIANARPFRMTWTMKETPSFK